MQYFLALLLLSWLLGYPTTASSQQTELTCPNPESSFFRQQIFAGQTQEERFVICEYVGDDFWYYGRSRENGKTVGFAIERIKQSTFRGKHDKYTYTIDTKTQTLYIRQGRRIEQTKKIMKISAQANKSAIQTP
jgi:hypothetical protein